ncbi:SprT family zinc-dependent metalloprotease [Psychromarinibacter sp. C21-152]|uniref:SprT family zinc-dependent metalloprotease n=1 Tax=Psychromarinibacter sediminicola TaxID=3033385 RepID=A0AAE3NUG2_9RHOB|nr:SprT family zinc-dependent metalloprotease [Psychromarinibacter sediminicola]MDF0602307.1 SprT family zinc-dependent metalloprotease [Psychromarinibacter sediminicola]
MGQAVLPGNPPVEITLRRSSRARRVSLRVSSLDGRVTLSMPQGMPEREALAFAREKSDWIRGHLDRRDAPVHVGIGATVLLRGAEVPVVAGAVRKAEVREGALVVPDAPAMAAARVKAHLKLDARARLEPAVRHYCTRIARRAGRITLRDTRSRWGSCTHEGNLMFSWRLAMAPEDVLDYVAAHEVAHLVELNHSPAYWRVVGDICPGFEAPRRWLKRHGAMLHRYRFGD